MTSAILNQIIISLLNVLEYKDSLEQLQYLHASTHCSAIFEHFFLYFAKPFFKHEVAPTKCFPCHLMWVQIRRLLPERLGTTPAAITWADK